MNTAGRQTTQFAQYVKTVALKTTQFVQHVNTAAQQTTQFAQHTKLRIILKTNIKSTCIIFWQANTLNRPIQGNASKQLQIMSLLAGNHCPLQRLLSSFQRLPNKKNNICFWGLARRTMLEIDARSSGRYLHSDDGIRSCLDDNRQPQTCSFAESQNFSLLIWRHQDCQTYFSIRVLTIPQSVYKTQDSVVLITSRPRLQSQLGCLIACHYRQFNERSSTSIAVLASVCMYACPSLQKRQIQTLFSRLSWPKVER